MMCGENSAEGGIPTNSRLGRTGIPYRGLVPYTEWTPDRAAACIAVPTASADKYSRGVLGVITGSAEYPGAAVLGVEAAMHTGVGMLRYLGDDRAAEFVLHRRPEIVTADGRVQAWLIGSGMDAGQRDALTTKQLRLTLDQGLPTVVDAGALDLVAVATGSVVVTPHFGELARLLDVERDQIAADPGQWAARAAEQLGVTVLLKGASTRVADPQGSRFTVTSATPWTATAGAGDALGGILGALLATHHREIVGDPTVVARLAATASVLHRLAAERVSRGGPFTVLHLTHALPAVIAELVR